MRCYGPSSCAVSLDASDFDGILAIPWAGQCVGKYSGYYAVPLPVPNCLAKDGPFNSVWCGRPGNDGHYRSQQKRRRPPLICRAEESSCAVPVLCVGALACHCKQQGPWGRGALKRKGWGGLIARLTPPPSRLYMAAASSTTVSNYSGIYTD